MDTEANKLAKNIDTEFNNLAKNMDTDLINLLRICILKQIHVHLQRI